MIMAANGHKDRKELSRRGVPEHRPEGRHSCRPVPDQGETNIAFPHGWAAGGTGPQTALRSSAANLGRTSQPSQSFVPARRSAPPSYGRAVLPRRRRNQSSAREIPGAISHGQTTQHTPRRTGHPSRLALTRSIHQHRRRSFSSPASSLSASTRAAGFATLTRRRSIGGPAGPPYLENSYSRSMRPFKVDDPHRG
jgi:hypothetical protein